MSVQVCYNEIDPWCCNRLRDRISDGGLPDGQVIEKDIRFLTPEEVAGYDQCHFFAGIGGAGLACRWAGFDRPIWTGGFPCQDISLAGTGKGLDGERSGLWHDWFRLIDAVRPPRLLIENSAGLRTRGIDRICEQLEGISYTCWPIVVGADDVGAPHRRKRCWVVCVADAELCGRGARSGEQGDQEGKGSGWDQSEGGGGVIMGDAMCGGLGTSGRTATEQPSQSGNGQVQRQGRLVNAGVQGLEGHGASPGQSEVAESRYAMPRRWPARPGQPQHEWEAPRLTQAGRRKARSSDKGSTESRLGAATHGVSGRVAGSDRTHRLKALGNAWVPQVAAAILRAWMKWE